MFSPVRSAGNRVDERLGVDPHRREQHLARAPLVDPHRLEAELVAVEREQRLDVGVLTTT